MKMTKSEKQYAASRINQMERDAIQTLLVETPDRTEAIKAAITLGEPLALQPAAKINEAARTNLVSGWRSGSLEFHHIFEPPKSYTKEVKEAETQIARNAPKIEAIKAAAQTAVDEIHLGNDGVSAISAFQETLATLLK